MSTSKRLRASLIHLSGSFGVAAIAVGLIYAIWYPSPISNATGVGAIFLIMILVDVAIGPLLTFVVYDIKKKNLSFDLAVIVALQLVAFSYGLWAIAAARPGWIVFNVDRFDVAQANELDLRFSSVALPEYREPPWLGPRWVASQIPNDLEKRNQLVRESSLGGPDLPQRPDLYVPIQAELDSIRRVARHFDELERYNAKDQVVAEIAKWPDADAWVPLMAKAKSMVVLVNSRSGKPIAIVDLRPWN